MKKVTKWFKAGIFCAFIWLFLFIFTSAFELFSSTEFYDGSIIFLCLDILEILVSLGVKICLTFAGVYYLYLKVDEYEKQEQEEKEKFDFEKEKTE